MKLQETFVFSLLHTLKYKYKDSIFYEDFYISQVASVTFRHLELQWAIVFERDHWEFTWQIAILKTERLTGISSIRSFPNRTFVIDAITAMYCWNWDRVSLLAEVSKNASVKSLVDLSAVTKIILIRNTGQDWS